MYPWLKNYPEIVNFKNLYKFWWVYFYFDLVNNSCMNKKIHIIYDFDTFKYSDTESIQCIKQFAKYTNSVF